MASYQSPLSAIIKGTIAGAAATHAMGQAMTRIPQLLERSGHALPPSPPGPTAPETPTGEVADRLVEGLAAQPPLSEEAKPVAAKAVHWSYGAGWGAAFGVVQASLKPPTMPMALLWGALVGAVSATAMPWMHLQLSPSERPAVLTGANFGYHLVYGAVMGVAWSILNLGRRG